MTVKYEPMYVLGQDYTITYDTTTTTNWKSQEQQALEAILRSLSVIESRLAIQERLLLALGENRLQEAEQAALEKFKKFLEEQQDGN